MRELTQYTGKDAAKDTGSSTNKVSEAWHDARKDAAREGGWGVPEKGGCLILIIASSTIFLAVANCLFG